MDIRTAHGTDHEEAGTAALRAVLEEHDLPCWLFTDLVTIDEQRRGALSHPLTISPSCWCSVPPWRSPQFLHEQLHWLDGPGTVSATAEACQRWPDPPPGSAGGTPDLASTWLHMSTCALEHESLSEILGSPAAADELRQHQGYFLDLRPDPRRARLVFWHPAPPRTPGSDGIPRRCFGEMPWVMTSN